MKSHEDKAPCPQCGLVVRHLKLHIRTMHTKDELKNHQCQECAKGFVSIDKLEKLRMNVHLKLRPYKCRYGCEFAYNDCSNRNAHEKKTHGSVFMTFKEKEGEGNKQNKNAY